MIKSVTLKNWKSYEESMLYIDPLTIVIGTNSSGKSNDIGNGLTMMNVIIKKAGRQEDGC